MKMFFNYNIAVSSFLGMCSKNIEIDWFVFTELFKDRRVDYLETHDWTCSV